MIIYCADGVTTIREPDNLRALSIQAHGEPDLDTLGSLEGTHAWVVIDELRRAARATGVPAGWDAQFDDMIAYAATKGWISEDGSSVRVHIEQIG